MSLRLEMGDPLLGPAGQVALEMLAELTPRGVVHREYSNMAITLADDGQQRGVILVDRRDWPIPEYGLDVWAAAFGRPSATWRSSGHVAFMRWPTVPLLEVQP